MYVIGVTNSTRQSTPLRVTYAPYDKACAEAAELAGGQPTIWKVGADTSIIGKPEAVNRLRTSGPMTA
jgi:hypothetical protein